MTFNLCNNSSFLFIKYSGKRIITKVNNVRDKYRKMKIIDGYRRFTSEEQDKYCKEHGVPPVNWTLKPWRNPLTESGFPVLGPIKYY